MNTRIFSASLFSAALLCVALLAACASQPFIPPGTRPEIARPLSQAELLWRSHKGAAAMQSVKVAEAVPNQTADEKNLIAKVKDNVGGNFPAVGNDPSQNYLPPNYSPNPPSQVPNEPHPY